MHLLSVTKMISNQKKTMLKLIFKSLLKLSRSIGKFVTTHSLICFAKKPFSIFILLILFYNSFKGKGIKLYKFIISLHSIILLLISIIVAIITVFILYNDGYFSILASLENKLIQNLIEIYNTLTSKIDDNIDLDEKFTPESISPFLDYENNNKEQIYTLNDKVEYLDYIWYNDPSILYSGLLVVLLLGLKYYGINIDDPDKITFSFSRVSSAVIILYNTFKIPIEIIFNPYKINNNNDNKINNNQNNNVNNNIELNNNNSTIEEDSILNSIIDIIL